MSDVRRGVAFPFVVLLGALALPAATLGQSPAGIAASPADAAHKLVAALAKGDIAGAVDFITTADRERCIALLQASDRLMESRTRFQQTVTTKFSENPASLALPAQTKPQRIDHIHIVAERNAGADAAELDVRGFGGENRVSPNVSTWHAVRENGQWRIRLPPCASNAAMGPLMNHYQGAITAADGVTASVLRGHITSLSDAHAALLEAERGILKAHGPRQ